MRFFFYGTLIDPDVRRLVLGVSAPVMVEPAVLMGWKRVPLPDVTYPNILRAQRLSVDGVLMRGLDKAACRRLIDYEGDGYDLLDVEVTVAGDRRVAALVFAGKPGQLRALGSWSFTDWQRRHKRRFVASLARRGSPSSSKCHCERSEAIQGGSHLPWIASSLRSSR